MEAIKSPLHAIAWMLAALMAIQVLTLIEAKTTRPPKEQPTQYEYIVDEYEYRRRQVLDDSPNARFANGVHQTRVNTYTRAIDWRDRMIQENKTYWDELDQREPLPANSLYSLVRPFVNRNGKKVLLPQEPMRPKGTLNLEALIASRQSEGYELLKTETATGRYEKSVVLLFFRRPKGHTYTAFEDPDTKLLEGVTLNF